MNRLKDNLNDRVAPVLMVTAIFGCFAGIALSPDPVTYPDINLPSENLVRLNAEYSDRVEVINRGRIIKTSDKQIVIRNQTGGLVAIPVSTKTKLEGLSVERASEIDLGAIVAVKQTAGSQEATSIRSLDN